MVNDDGEPVLYHPGPFVVIEDGEPEDWVKEHGEEGELYAYPPGLGEPGFFEDWHDGIASAREVFRTFLRRRGLDDHGRPLDAPHHGA